MPLWLFFLLLGEQTYFRDHILGVKFLIADVILARVVINEIFFHQEIVGCGYLVSDVIFKISFGLSDIISVIFHIFKNFAI